MSDIDAVAEVHLRRSHEMEVPGRVEVDGLGTARGKPNITKEVPDSSLY